MQKQVSRPDVKAFENRYRYDPVQEHAALFDSQGHGVVARDGDEDSVAFTPQELSRACMGFLTHSHPHGKPPSQRDLMIAAQYGLTLRAFGDTPDGESYEYTVQFTAPSEQKAVIVEADFDDEEQQARRELSTDPLNDLQWEREARNLAVTRLAQRLGFQYTRVRRHVSLSEMSSHESKRLEVLATLESQLQSAILKPLHADIVRALYRNADATGHISPERLPVVRQDITRIVQRMLLGTPMLDGSLAPYTVQHGQVVARSAFFRLLWTLMREAASVSVQRHAEIMRQYLPKDMVRALEYATVSPFSDVSEMDETPDPLHEWLGPDGRRLIDRIWNVAGDLRRRIDTFVTGLSASGRKVSDIDGALESYLDGVGSFEMKRLARGEVSQAGSRADRLAANFNPLVEMYRTVLSPAHKEIDECDDNASRGPYPKNDIEHLAPLHVGCLCSIVWELVKDIEAVVTSLREKVMQAITAAKLSFIDIIGPLSRKFLDLLFGGRS